MGAFPKEEELKKLLPWSENLPEYCRTKLKIIISHLIENLADSQEQYQMAFIKCQYTNDYLLTFCLQITLFPNEKQITQ